MEILAPAGNKENLIAAINGGANAVYLGLTNFSARKGADNFSFDDLKFAINYAKTFNVKVYLTVNTIVKNLELNDFINTILKANSLGVDAFILQDVFLGKYLKRLIPNINLHLSTQAGVSNVYGAKLAKNCGFSRVILARETTLEDIKEIAKIIETEVFVQVALCSCFSGHCYFSSFIGSNSGNRGYCKQPCRKKCSFYNNLNKELTLGYSLSLSDLNLSSKINELSNIGVSSIKIEGRMRSKEYVYFSTKLYSEVLNGIYNKDTQINLQKTYNRGDYTLGLAFNQDNSFISNKIQGHKGYFVAKIKAKKGDNLIIDKNITLNNGDSFKIIRNGYEVGNAICVKNSNGLNIKFKGDVKVGDGLFITKDTSLINTIENIKANVIVKVYAKKGENLKLTLNDIVVESNEPLETANSNPITKEEVIKNLNKTDIYPYKPTIIFDYFDENLFIVKSKLNQLRAELYSRSFNRKYCILCDNISNNNDYSIKCSTCFDNENSVILYELATVSSDVKNVIYSPKDYTSSYNEFINYFKDKKVWLYLPPYASSEEIAVIDNMVNDFYGVFIDGYWGLEYATSKNINIFIGTGLNLFNNIDINEILSYSSIKQITLSKELSSKEISDFKGNFTVLNASELQIMDLIYCPFSKNCKTCNYTNNSYLKDDEGRVFPIFRYKFKNCRFKVYNMAEIYAKNLDNYNTLYDLTTKSKKFIEEFFSKDNNDDRVKLYKNLTVGNYNKGIKWLKTKRY